MSSFLVMETLLGCNVGFTSFAHAPNMLRAMQMAPTSLRTACLFLLVLGQTACATSSGSVDGADGDASTSFPDAGAGDATLTDVASSVDALSDNHATTDTESDAAPKIPTCDDPPPPEALVPAGVLGGTRILPGGRAITPMGTHNAIGGFPVDVRVDPQGKYAYVANTGYGNEHRSIQVIDLISGNVLQEIVRTEAFYGLALTSDGKRLYAAGGFASVVDAYDVGVNGLLKAAGSITVDGYPAGMAISQDGKRLWVGKFKGNAVAEVDLTTLAVTRTFPLLFGAYGVLDVPSKSELYVAGFADSKIAVVNYALPLPIVVATITVGGNPVGLVRSPSGDRVYASSTNGDVIVAIDTSSHQVVDSHAVGEASLVGEGGSPLPASSPSGLAIDAVGSTLYVARSADNAISLFDAAHLTPLGSIPVAWYPTAVALARGDGLLVATNGKGVGTGPLLAAHDDEGKHAMNGSISIVPLGGLDLASSTKQVEDNVRRPDRVYPFTCKDPFPIPTKPGEKSPIEHVVLIVRENKTYDSVLGDLATGERDPSLTLFGETITPNLHALARQFTSHDNFYDDSETSVQGHEWLTSNFCNDYIERTWFEDYRGHPGWGSDPAFPQGRPSWQSFFAHLMRHHIDFRVYGEITGSLDIVDGQNVLATHGDLAFPGGFFNLGTKDKDKATYVAKRIVDDGQFPPFVYVLLPNDHTQGTTPGKPTPQSMIADNDEATGLLIDRISHSHWWSSTAIFLVEDDPQIGADHVDYHRSILLVASPWAKHAHTSSVHTSYPSIFRTMEAILGVPPMNRYDALATPLWDAFAKSSDPAPFTLLPRSVPEANNLRYAPLAALSEKMDFSGPDKNPDLGDVLYWVMKGHARPGSRLARLPLAQIQAEYARDAVHDDDD